MAEEKRIFPVGRGILVVGAAMLLFGLFLPWFTLTGTSSTLPADTYTGVNLTNLLNTLAKGPWTWAAFAWLLLCIVMAVVAALLGRKFANFGTSGVLVMILYAILIYVAVNLTNGNSPPTEQAGLGVAYGFFVSIIGSALIETGTRISKPKPMEAPAAPPAEPAKPM